MASTLPFLNKSFNQLSLIGKVIYLASAVGTLAAGAVAIFQASAYAGDVFDGRVITLINDNAYEAVSVQVSDQLTAIKHSTTRSQLTQQMSMNRMELRFIKSDISDITRNAGDSLTHEEQADIDQLRDDRTFLKEENQQLREQLQAIDE